jgi:probable rRNA maturation factor
MTVSIQRRASIKNRRGAPASATLRRRVTLMLAALQMPKAEVSIVVTDDKEIRILNRDYRGIDRPTDVLSFSMREGEGARFAGDALGDLVISLPTAARQAREAKRPLLDETTMLLAHGLLHLLGWDHATPADDRKMRAETDRLCVAAGTPPLFSLGGVDASGRSRPIRRPPPRPRRRT